MSISSIEHDPSDNESSPYSGRRMLESSNGTARTQQSAGNHLSRGVVDIPRWRFWLSRLAAGAMIIVCSPLMAIAYLLVRWTSPGPGLYRQTRLGLHGREFEVLKLRSMTTDAESQTGPVWATKNDPRVTPVGRWLRKLHIDELPQLINVFRGEMALVGPRPERPQIAETLTESLPEFPGRLNVRPGVTGLAQINLPANTDLESARRKLFLDIEYVKTNSLWMDLRIIAATAPRLVGCRRGLLQHINRFLGVSREVPAADFGRGDGDITPAFAFNLARQQRNPTAAKGWSIPPLDRSKSLFSYGTNGSGERRQKLAYLTHLPITQWLFLKGQNDFMSANGFELHALSSPGDRLDMLASRDHVTPHEVPIARSISPWHDFISLIRIVVALRRIRPDVLHLSTPKAALLGAIAARLTGVPVSIFLVRGFTSAQSHGLTRYFFQKLERLTVCLATSTLCNAPSLLAYGRRVGILKETEGIVLLNGMSNGVDLDRFEQNEIDPASRDHETEPDAERGNGLVLGFVGRLAFDKGIGILADSWKVIREEFPDSELLLVGPWETRDTVPEDVREYLNSDPRVTMTGAVDDVRPYLKRMDLFVFPSFGEGFPNAPMEAAAFEIPVITTNAVGCVDAVEDGITGTIIPPRDVGALTEAIRTYLNDADLREKHGCAGRIRLKSDFQRQPIWEALLDHYRGLLEKHGRPAVTAQAAYREPVAAIEFEFNRVASPGE